MLSITDAIEFVLMEAAGEPLTSADIFARLPREVIDVPVGVLFDTKTFWQFFGMFLKNRSNEMGWVRLDNGKRAYFLLRLGG